MLKVFIDTSAFIALLISSENWHQQIVNQYQDYKERNTFFFTNYFVLNELYTRLIYDFNKTKCEKAINKIRKLKEEGKIGIFEIDPILFKKSERAFLKFSEHKISFTDATIYICVKEYKLDEVFSLDSDFKKIGLKSAPSVV